MLFNAIMSHGRKNRSPGRPPAAARPAVASPAAARAPRPTRDRLAPGPIARGGLLAAGSLWDVFADYSPMTTRKVEDDPSDVNHPEPAERDQAQQALQDNHDAEQQAISALGADQQDQYNALASQLQGDVMARRALQQLLLAGQLPGTAPLKGDGNLLSQLYLLTQQALADGVDRATLLGNLVGEIQNPVRIDQQQRGTCAATTAQILLARRHPAEYVRLVAGLAAPDGTVTMAGGGTLTRDPDWADAADGDRTTSSRLFQPAVMNAGQDQPGETYSNRDDNGHLGDQTLPGGLSQLGSARVNTQLEGVAYNNVDFLPWEASANLDQLTAAVNAGHGAVPASLTWNSDGLVGGHEVQVDKIADGRVYYTNPWGQAESMAADQFVSHTVAVAIPQA